MPPGKVRLARLLRGGFKEGWQRLENGAAGAQSAHKAKAGALPRPLLWFGGPSARQTPPPPAGISANLPSRPRISLPLPA